jgi:uncharacterized protein DUF732
MTGDRIAAAAAAGFAWATLLALAGGCAEKGQPAPSIGPSQQRSLTFAETTFVSHMSGSGLSGDSHQLVAQGHDVCDRLSSGTRVVDVTRQMASRANLTLQQAILLANYAHRDLCPGVQARA